MPFFLHLKHCILDNNLTSHLFIKKSSQFTLISKVTLNYMEPAILLFSHNNWHFFHLEAGTWVQAFCIIYLSCIILHCYFLLDWSSVAQITKSPCRLFFLKYTVLTLLKRHSMEITDFIFSVCVLGQRESFQYIYITLIQPKHYYIDNQ